MSSNLTQIRAKYQRLARVLDERSRRLWAATEAAEAGWGGVSKVAEATGLARNTIAAGLQELKKRGRPSRVALERVRRVGGGRKSLLETDPKILQALERLVAPATRGDPESALRWTCKSTRHLAEELTRAGYPIGDRSVASLLKHIGYSLQANQKAKEGTAHPDRNAQFEYINRQTLAFQKRGQPVVSVDTKKKELIGDFRNFGREWHPKGQPEPVQVHDFEYPELGKGIPYGVYDVTDNSGWVSVGTDHDTAEFAVETIRRWWRKMGERAYPQAKELLIMADAGGSNGARLRLWKVQIQKFADQTGLKISVCHFPPGTSKWNKIEHRMFSFITQNWRGRSLISHQVMVNLIGHTTTRTGLKIRAQLDNGHYDTGVKVTPQEYKALNLKPAAFQGVWNYTISPKAV
jgi:DNA-binding phage protein